MNLFFCSMSINTRWLTLAPALEQIKKRWEDPRAYFLVHVANKPEYKKVLPRNKKFLQVAEALMDDTKLLLQNTFLIKLLPYSPDFSLCFREKGDLSK